MLSILDQMKMDLRDEFATKSDFDEAVTRIDKLEEDRDEMQTELERM